MTAPRLRRRLRPDALGPRPAQEPRRRRGADPRGGRAGRALRPDAGDDLARRALARGAVREDRPAGARSDAGRPAGGRRGRRASSSISARSPCLRARGSRTAPSSSTRLARSPPPTTRSTSSTSICRTARAGAKFAHLQRRRPRRRGRDALGLSRGDHLLRRALPGALPGARGGAEPPTSPRRPASPARPAKPIGTCCTGRAPSRPAPS